VTSKELNNWAVMNLSMEDRGLLDPAAQQQQPAGGRYLSGDIRCVEGWGGCRPFVMGIWCLQQHSSRLG
jgi:hypothetical protein